WRFLASLAGASGARPSPDLGSDTQLLKNGGFSAAVSFSFIETTRPRPIAGQGPAKANSPGAKSEAGKDGNRDRNGAGEGGDIEREDIDRRAQQRRCRIDFLLQQQGRFPGDEIARKAAEGRRHQAEHDGDEWAGTGAAGNIRSHHREGGETQCIRPEQQRVAALDAAGEKVK